MAGACPDAPAPVPSDVRVAREEVIVHVPGCKWNTQCMTYCHEIRSAPVEGKTTYLGRPLTNPSKIERRCREQGLMRQLSTR